MVISPLTLQCRATVPSLSSTSSRDIGWQSLLLDVHRGISSSDAYTSIPTPDARIGVSISGRYSCDFALLGRWRHDQHAPGTICVHRTGEAERYRFPRPSDRDFQMALIYIPAGLLESAIDEFRRPGQPSRLPVLRSIVDRDPAITHMAHALMRAAANREGELYAETSAAWLAVHLLSRYGPGAPIEDDRLPVDLGDARLARVIDYIATHYADQLTLERLAAEACVSKYHFTRLFREKTGLTPYRYLTQVRLDAARRMLATTDVPSSQVALACGYQSVSRFSSAFAERFGAPPRAFRAMR